MDLARRFIFRANACALGGRMYRPTDQLITSPATSALAVVGGRAEGHARRVRCKPYVSVGEATTRVEGAFDRRAQAVAWTHGRVEEDAMSATSTAFSDVTDLAVSKRLTAGRVSASLVSKSPSGSREAAIRLRRDTTLADVAIDGHPLVITVNRRAFELYDTRSKLRAAADEAAFVKKHGGCFFMQDGVAGRSAPARPRLVDEGGVILATIVSSIRWKDRPHPEATIDGHVVIVPDFGRVFFGEIFITDVSRRLTMIRLRLGSPEGGSVGVSEVETNGSWFPPTS